VPGDRDPLVDDLHELGPVGSVLTRNQARKVIADLVALKEKYAIKRFGAFYGRYLKAPDVQKPLKRGIASLLQRRTLPSVAAYMLKHRLGSVSFCKGEVFYQGGDNSLRPMESWEPLITLMNDTETPSDPEREVPEDKTPVAEKAAHSPGPAAKANSQYRPTEGLQSGSVTYMPGPLQQILFIETGFGCDQHGQDATKAAVRACRNAIEFNSLPSLRTLVPGGLSNLKLLVTLGVPEKFKDDIIITQVQNVFPYGQNAEVKVEVGGLAASSGIGVPELGDTDDTMIIVVAHVVVGY